MHRDIFMLTQMIMEAVPEIQAASEFLPSSTLREGMNELRRVLRKALVSGVVKTKEDHRRVVLNPNIRLVFGNASRLLRVVAETCANPDPMLQAWVGGRATKNPTGRTQEIVTEIQTWAAEQQVKPATLRLVLQALTPRGVPRSWAAAQATMAPASIVIYRKSVEAFLKWRGGDLDVGAKVQVAAPVSSEQTKKRISIRALQLQVYRFTNLNHWTWKDVEIRKSWGENPLKNGEGMEIATIAYVQPFGKVRRPNQSFPWISEEARVLRRLAVEVYRDQFAVDADLEEWLEAFADGTLDPFSDELESMQDFLATLDGRILPPDLDEQES